MQHHFGDAGGTRGVFVLDDDTCGEEFVQNPVSPRFHSLLGADADDVDGGDVRSVDFVRTDSRELVERLSGACAVVESMAQLDDVEFQPRMVLTASEREEDRTVVRKYLAHVGVTSQHVEDLAVQILTEARGEL
jgi:hypothetical protein